MQARFVLDGVEICTKGSNNIYMHMESGTSTQIVLSVQCAYDFVQTLNHVCRNNSECGN